MSEPADPTREVVTQVAVEAAPRRRVPALLPARARAMRRPRWWQEIAFVALCYWLYSLVRNAVPNHEVAARHRAADILAVEHALRINVESSLNGLVAHTSWLAYGCNYYYATLHFVVTIGVLGWLYLKHPLRYRSIRSVLFATNLVALLGFWFYALAPPRLMDGGGYVDTIIAFHTWGSWGSADVASASNQFAAMPSLHIGWSLWCAVAIVGLAERRWVRVLGALYPCVTLFVIVGTANHFLLDAVGGVVALLAGFAVQRLMSGRPALAPPTVAALHPSELAAAA